VGRACRPSRSGSSPESGETDLGRCSSHAIRSCSAAAWTYGPQYERRNLKTGGMGWNIMESWHQPWVKEGKSNAHPLLVSRSATFLLLAFTVHQAAWLGQVGGILHTSSRQWRPLLRKTATSQMCFSAARLSFRHGDGTAADGRANTNRSWRDLGVSVGIGYG
jgi:hypothetical protein